MAARVNDLGNDNISKLIIRLGIPAMFAQFVNVLYGIVDRMFIGNIEGIGEMALAGVGVCSPIMTLITSFSFLVGLGGSPLLAMRLGEGNREKAQDIMSNCFVMLLGISVIATGVFLAVKGPMLMLFGASEKTFPYANEYMTVYICGSIFAILSVGLNNFITCQGFSKTSMMTVLIGAILNIVLDPIFIFTLKMGVMGAALATVLSQAASCIWVVAFLLSKRSIVKIRIKNLSVRIMGRIVKLGLSPFLIIATDSIVIILFNSVLQKYGGIESGDMYVAAATIVLSYMQLITMPMGGITMGCQPILSFNYGARKLDRVKRAFIGVNVICVVFTAIMFVLSFTVSQYFVGIFKAGGEISDMAVWGIKVYTIGIIVLALQYACVDNLTALGQAGAAITLSLTRKLGTMTICTLVLPIFFGAKGAFYAEPIADIVAGIAATTVSVILLPKILRRREMGGEIK